MLGKRVLRRTKAIFNRGRKVLRVSFELPDRQHLLSLTPDQRRCLSDRWRVMADDGGIMPDPQMCMSDGVEYPSDTPGTATPKEHDSAPRPQSDAIVERLTGIRAVIREQVDASAILPQPATASALAVPLEGSDGHVSPADVADAAEAKSGLPHPSAMAREVEVTETQPRVEARDSGFNGTSSLATESTHGTAQALPVMGKRMVVYQPLDTSVWESTDDEKALYSSTCEQMSSTSAAAACPPTSRETRMVVFQPLDTSGWEPPDFEVPLRRRAFSKTTIFMIRWPPTARARTTVFHPLDASTRESSGESKLLPKSGSESAKALVPVHRPFSVDVWKREPTCSYEDEERSSEADRGVFAGQLDSRMIRVVAVILLVLCGAIIRWRRCQIQSVAPAIGAGRPGLTVTSNASSPSERRVSEDDAGNESPTRVESEGRVEPATVPAVPAPRSEMAAANMARPAPGLVSSRDESSPSGLAATAEPAATATVTVNRRLSVRSAIAGMVAVGQDKQDGRVVAAGAGGEPRADLASEVAIEVSTVATDREGKEKKEEEEEEEEEGKCEGNVASSASSACVPSAVDISAVDVAAVGGEEAAQEEQEASAGGRAASSASTVLAPAKRGIPTLDATADGEAEGKKNGGGKVVSSAVAMPDREARDWSPVAAAAEEEGEDPGGKGEGKCATSVVEVSVLGVESSSSGASAAVDKEEKDEGKEGGEGDAAVPALETSVQQVGHISPVATVAVGTKDVEAKGESKVRVSTMEMSATEARKSSGVPPAAVDEEACETKDEEKGEGYTGASASEMSTPEKGAGGAATGQSEIADRGNSPPTAGRGSGIGMVATPLPAATLSAPVKSAVQDPAHQAISGESSDKAGRETGGAPAAAKVAKPASFGTDSDIASKRGPQVSLDEERKAKEVDSAWVPDPNSSFELPGPKDDVSDLKWDQFDLGTSHRLGAKRVKPFDLSDYSTPLDPSQFSADKVATARRLAIEIESGVSANPHVREERNQKTAKGDTRGEEDRYSGVLRPSTTSRHHRDSLCSTGVRGKASSRGVEATPPPDRKNDGAFVAPPARNAFAMRFAPRAPADEQHLRPNAGGGAVEAGRSAVAAGPNKRAQETDRDDKETQLWNILRPAPSAAPGRANGGPSNAPIPPSAPTSAATRGSTKKAGMPVAGAPKKSGGIRGRNNAHHNNGCNGEATAQDYRVRSAADPGATTLERGAASNGGVTSGGGCGVTRDAASGGASRATPSSPSRQVARQELLCLLRVNPSSSTGGTPTAGATAAVISSPPTLAPGLRAGGTVAAATWAERTSNCTTLPEKDGGQTMRAARAGSSTPAGQEEAGQELAGEGGGHSGRGRRDPHQRQFRQRGGACAEGSANADPREGGASDGPRRPDVEVRRQRQARVTRSHQIATAATIVDEADAGEINKPDKGLVVDRRCKHSMF